MNNPKTNTVLEIINAIVIEPTWVTTAAEVQADSNYHPRLNVWGIWTDEQKYNPEGRIKSFVSGLRKYVNGVTDGQIVTNVDGSNYFQPQIDECNRVIAEIESAFEN